MRRPPSIERVLAIEAERVESTVPPGSVGDVVAWVGQDPGRARRARESERKRSKPRRTLLEALDAVEATELDEEE